MTDPLTALPAEWLADPVVRLLISDAVSLGPLHLADLVVGLKANYLAVRVLRVCPCGARVGWLCGKCRKCLESEPKGNP